MSATVHHLRRHPPTLTLAEAKAEGARPPMNVGAYVHEILEAANSLLRNGFRIVSFFARQNPPQLMIELQDCPDLRALARTGSATYDDRGHDESGPYRTGFFTRGAVTAFWRERGAS